MGTTNDLKKMVGDVLRPNGFQPHGGDWYLRQTETLAVVNLQKSQYAVKYYVNIALWLLALGKTSFPKEHHCHVRTRLEGIVPPSQEAEVETLFDFERPMASDRRKDRIQILLEREVIPLLRACDTLENLKGENGRRLLRHSAVTVDAQQLLAPL